MSPEVWCYFVEPRLENSATLNEPYDQHHNRDDQEDVDEVSEMRVVRAPESESPKEHEQNNDGFEHGHSPSEKSAVRPIGIGGLRRMLLGGASLRKASRGALAVFGT